MRSRLLELLRCPACGGRLKPEAFASSADGSDLIEGELRCRCGAGFPIVETIPRMLLNAYELFPAFVRRYADRLQGRSAGSGAPPSVGRVTRTLARTQESFGYQWTAFSEMSCDFRANFWNYLEPATEEFFRGRLGLDAGCGFGRHIYHAAACGAEMVGVDFSRAIESTRRNTSHLPNVHLVQADIYRLPFAAGTFDFIYSIGVLHHLPDPLGGAKSLAARLKPGGTLFVWLYSSKRRVVNALLEAGRAATTRMPHQLVQGVSWLAAAIDWGGFVLPYRAFRRMPLLDGWMERLAPARVKLYAQYPFQVSYADWFDRLAAPVRWYYDEQGVRTFMESATLSNIQVSATGLYGWRAHGIRAPQLSGTAHSDANAQVAGTA